MSLMIFKAFVCADIGSFLILWVLVNIFGVNSKSLSIKAQTVLGFLAFVLIVGTIISGVIALFWWSVS